MNEKPRLTVAIPTHEMPDRVVFLKRLLNSLWNQSFQSFEIVVTDNSDDDTLQEICEFYGGIRYYKNPRKGMATNTNAAILRSKGELIKILYLDDYLIHDEVLKEIVETSEEDGTNWIICGADNNTNPYWTDDIETGNNKLGSPSALTIKNDKPPLFDEKLSWMLDVVYYKKLYERYGRPTIISGKHIGIGVGEHQTTFTMTDDDKIKELEYVTKRYG